eukprot:4702268-Amphidinium_carterae.1
MPQDYPMTAADFTQQDHYFVVIHTTEQLLRDLKEDLERNAQRSDMAGSWQEQNLKDLEETETEEA